MAEQTQPKTAEVEWVTPAGQLSSELTPANGRELFRWTRQLKAEETAFDDAVKYSVVEGQLPCGLDLDPVTGVIDGTVTEMDECVPGWSQLDVDDYDTPEMSGGNYATVGSAAAGEHTFTFTVRAAAVNYDAYADRQFSILVVNNWSSDRDRFIREYLGEDKFQAMKAAGYLPPLSNA